MQGGDGSQSPPYDVGISLNGGSRYIPSGQGFMVKVANVAVPVFGTDDISTTFTIPANARTHNNQAYYKNTVQIPNFIKINIQKDNFTDETVIRTLPEGATDEHDAKFDAYKMFAWDNTKPQLFSVNENNTEVYAINSLPEFTENKIIPLGIYIGSSGEYTINSTENNFDIFDVYLHDKFTDKYTKIINETPYKFNSEAGTFTDRLELVFKKSSSDVLNKESGNVNLFPNPNKGSFNLSVNSDDNYRVEITNVTGQVVYKNKFKGKGNKEIKLNNVSDGVYFVKIVLKNSKIVTKKIIIE